MSGDTTTTVSKESNQLEILVVDDMAVNQKLLVMQLSKLGFKAATAKSGPQAIDMVARSSYALILMDCDMPGMDGFQATRAIRELEQGKGLKKTPIVAITSHDGEEDERRCAAAGMDDYLAKGVGVQRLREVVERFAKIAAGGAPETSDAEADLALTDLKVLAENFSSLEVQDTAATFVQAGRTLMSCIDRSIQLGDSKRVVYFSFSLKGPCATIGQKEMAKLAGELASSAQGNNWHLARVKYQMLKALFDKAVETLDALAGSQG